MNDRIKTFPYRYEKFTVTNDYAFEKIFGTEKNRLFSSSNYRR